MENYKVSFSPETQAVQFEGTFLLPTRSDYQTLFMEFSNRIENNPGQYTFDMRNCKMMNSSGIEVLMRSLINFNNSQITIFGNGESSWQKRTLANIKNMLANIDVTLS